MRRVPFAVLLGAVALVLLVLVLVDDADSAPTYSKHRVRSAICSVFTGTRCGPAIRVASCETGGTLNPYALGSAGERGIFQIHPIHFGWLDERLLWRPLYNARIAFRLSRGGRDWGPWSCRWAA